MFKELILKLKRKVYREIGTVSLHKKLIKYITKTIRNPKFKVIVTDVPTPINEKELGFIFYLTNSKGEVELKGEVKLVDVIKIW